MLAEQALRPSPAVGDAQHALACNAPNVVANAQGQTQLIDCNVVPQ